LKNKAKLNLIDNYVEIHRCIFECKNAIKLSKDVNTLKNLNELCSSILQLKKLYEKAFVELKIMDDSLILLKMQLEKVLKNPPDVLENKKIHSIEFLTNKKNLLEKDLRKLV